MENRTRTGCWITANVAMTLIALALLAAILSSCASLPREHKDVTNIQYSPRVKNALTFLYGHIQDVEFGFCNYGRVSNDTLFVDHTEMALIQRAVPDSILLYCEKEALGAGHSHRRIHGTRACGFSEIDLRGFVQSGHQFLFVLCGDDNDSTAVHSIAATRKDAIEALKQGAAHARLPP